MKRLFILLIPVILITFVGCGSGGGSSSSPTTTVALPSGEILSWTTPTENADGTPINGLEGYKISYGPSGIYGTTIPIPVVGTITYDATVLPSGYTCFVVRAYDTSGNESINSDEVCATL